MSTALTTTSAPPESVGVSIADIPAVIIVAAPPTDRCPVCRHRARGQCEWCGGAMGHPAFGLPPCRVCPHGRRLA